MTKWEYKVVKLGSDIIRGILGTQTELNQLGKEGWEVVAAWGVNVILKRPIEVSERSKEDK